ncbi:MAG TPA: hypothetical protein PKL75_11695 [Treponemataceae bacterium]|nr:hypothetical protein [Treponemataceae bacterium]
MTRILAFAFRNVFRSPARSASLAAIATIGACVLILIAAGYEDLFHNAAAQSVASDGDILLTREDVADAAAADDVTDTDASAKSAALTWAEYRQAKQRLLASPFVKEVRAESKIDGIVGTAERSAPCSGSAFEDGVRADGEAIPATMGDALARTLGIAKGAEVGGLVADCGMTLKVAETVKTEATLRDRFYVKIPLDALVSAEADPKVDAIRVWLKDGVSAPSLGRESGSAGYDGALKAIAGMTELKGYSIRSMPKGNTEINKIVGVYRSNYRVVAIVVGLTIALAFLNVLSLSVYERQQELGTLRSMGTPIAQIRTMLVAETLVVALASCCAAAAISAIAGAVINACGGLTFPAPPGESSDIHVGMLVTASRIAKVSALVLLGGALSALAGSVKLGTASIVGQLEIRD